MESSRAARLVAWVRAWRAGHLSLDDAATAVEGDDAEHDVADLPGEVHAVPLRRALGFLSTVDPDAVRLVLPAAGDPRGLPGPGPFTTAALAAGEGAICGTTGLVPAVERRVSGSGDVWHTVLWHVVPVPAAAAPLDAPMLPDAEHDLLETLRTSTDALRDLDVARWRPELADALTGLRGRPAEADLPPGYSPRAHRVMHRAQLVGRILDLAATDAPGAAVTAFEASARDAALRPLRTAARRATMAAVNSPVR